MLENYSFVPLHLRATKDTSNMTEEIGLGLLVDVCLENSLARGLRVVEGVCGNTCLAPPLLKVISKKPQMKVSGQRV